MNSRKWLAAGVQALTALSMVGCSSSGSGSGGSAEGDAASGESKPLIVGMTQQLDGNFCPLWSTTAYDQWVTNLVYEKMLDYNADNELYPQIAAEMPVLAEDSNSVTYKLKEGLTFSDGSELDANDVKFTFTLMADPEYKGQLNDGAFNFIEGWDEYMNGDATEVTGIVVEDPTTITFKFAQQNIDAVNGIGTFWIMSDTQFPYEKGNLGGYKDSPSETLGSNGYVINTYDKSAGASLVKNENYHNDANYLIPQLVIKTIGVGTELATLQSGDVNMLPNLIEATIIGPASMDENIAYNYYFRAAEGYIGFNCNSGPTADPAVRQALSYATPREDFVKAYYAFPEANEEVAAVGVGYKPTAFWSPVADGMGDYTTGAADLEGLIHYDYDLEKAKQILDDAGWTVGSDGIREKDGQRLEVKFLASDGNDVLNMLLPMIIDSWGQLGVDLKQNTVEFNAMLATVGDLENEDTSNWSAFFMATGFTGLSNTTMNFLLGYQMDGDKVIYMGNNYPRLVDEEINGYLNDAMYTTDVEVSLENYKKAMVRESELAPYLAMYGNNIFDLYSTNIKNFKTGSVCNWSQALSGVVVE